MRLIDADAMLLRNKNSIYDTTDLEEMLFYESTACDIDKVIERLENLKGLYCRYDDELELIAEVCDDAIEIVKDGMNKLIK